MRQPDQQLLDGLDGAKTVRGREAALLDRYIAGRGLRHSRQRDQVIAAFFSLEGHVSIEELVAQVRRREPSVSVATVYRTMRLLRDCGLAVGRQFGDGQTRFESAAGRPRHDHLICTACGLIVEFSSPHVEAAQASTAEAHGFEVENRKLEFYGRCARCRVAPASDARELA